MGRKLTHYYPSTNINSYGYLGSEIESVFEEMMKKINNHQTVHGLLIVVVEERITLLMQVGIFRTIPAKSKPNLVFLIYPLDALSTKTIDRILGLISKNLIRL